MTRLKLDIGDVVAAFILGIIVGIFVSHSFSSPSSEARFQLGSGFLQFPPLLADFVPAGVAPPPAPAFIESLSNLVDSTTAGAGLPEPAPTLVTAYCPCEKCCGIYSDRVTASGHIIEPNDHFVAAPPDIPFGTLLAIEGYAGGRMVSVEDRGGAIQGNRLDVFFSDHDEALAWGVKEFEVAQ